MWGSLESSNKELTKDVTSFANAHGGFILIGIEEDNDGNPKQIIGVEDVDKNILRIRQVCHANIQPLISGMKIHPVRIDDKKCIIIIYIPDSFEKPHMVLQDYRCYIRYERGKNPMTIHQIEDAIKGREKNSEKIREFLSKRNKELQKLVKNNSAINFSIVPNFLEKERFDIFSSKTEKAVDYFIRKNLIKSRFIPTFDGFIASDGSDETEYRQLLIQSTGYIEYFIYIPFRDKLDAEWFDNEMMKFIEIASEFYSELDLYFRGWFNVEFFNMINFTLRLDEKNSREKSKLIVNKDGYFALPNIGFEHFNEQIANIQRKTNDFLWRKFGITRAHIN
jgi:predicted HTH transcriptional regulator